MIEELREKIPGEEFDYQALLQGLHEYDRPRDKITTLLRRKDIIRVKKGFYIFGETYARRPFSREVLANMIYGPSYVSLDYALHYHGLIPERVEAVTSIPGPTRPIIGNCATTSPGTYGTLAIVANGYYELLEPGISYKPDFRHEKGDLRPQNTFHLAISF